jgi:hypothetical protein
MHDQNEVKVVVFAQALSAKTLRLLGQLLVDLTRATEPTVCKLCVISTLELEVHKLMMRRSTLQTGFDERECAL